MINSKYKNNKLLNFPRDEAPFPPPNKKKEKKKKKFLTHGNLLPQTSKLPFKSKCSPKMLLNAQMDKHICSNQTCNSLNLLFNRILSRMKNQTI